MSLLMTNTLELHGGNLFAIIWRGLGTLYVAVPGCYPAFDSLGIQSLPDHYSLGSGVNPSEHHTFGITLCTSLICVELEIGFISREAEVRF